MHSRTPSKWAIYAATVTALGSSAASASIVYKSINATLTDAATSDGKAANVSQNSAATSGAIHFDGTAITFDHSTTGGAAVINAIDDSSYGLKVAGNRNSYSGYLQTPDLLQAGDAIGDNFVQSTTMLLLPSGSANDVYVGVATPAKNYGWVHFSYSDSGRTVTIVDAAFESVPYTAITAGAGAGASSAPTQRRPIKSSFGLLGLAGGLATLRRKRSSNSAAA